MQQELIEMLDKMVKYFDEISSDSYYYRETAAILNEAEKLVEKAKNSAKEPAVPMPQNEDQAAAMALLGHAWLRDNAPHRLIQQEPVTLTDEHPMQPIVKANDGVIRFKKNQIVSDLYDLAAKHGLDMYELACRKYPQEDRNQFAQLIGYSVSGWGDLSYAMNVDGADIIAALREKQAKATPGATHE